MSAKSKPLKTGAPDRIRTCDLCLRRAALYPAELRVPVHNAVKRLAAGVAVCQSLIWGRQYFARDGFESCKPALAVRLFDLGLFDLLEFAKAASCARLHSAAYVAQHPDDVDIAQPVG